MEEARAAPPAIASMANAEAITHRHAERAILDDGVAVTVDVGQAEVVPEGHLRASDVDAAPKDHPEVRARDRGRLLIARVVTTLDLQVAAGLERERRTREQVRGHGLASGEPV